MDDLLKMWHEKYFIASFLTQYFYARLSDAGRLAALKDTIRSLLKENPAGGYVLLLANVDSAPQHVRVRFPDKNYKMSELFNPPGAAQCERKDDAFEFLSVPSDVRVFQIDLQ